MKPLYFYFNKPLPHIIYPLSLHDALPISCRDCLSSSSAGGQCHAELQDHAEPRGCPKRGSRSRTSSDRKSTRLNSSHVSISYAVFCLKKKRTTANRCS